MRTYFAALAQAQSRDEIIREQIQGNWVVDIGMDGLEAMVVETAVEMAPDGSVKSAEINPSTDNSLPNWPFFAQSCLRADMKSSPLRMSPDKPYEAWRRLNLRSTAKELSGSWCGTWEPPVGSYSGRAIRPGLRRNSSRRAY